MGNKVILKFLADYADLRRELL